MHNFADDTHLLHANDNVGVIEIRMNDDLATMVDWLRASKLSLNEFKTEAILFHSSRKKEIIKPKLFVNSQQVKFSENVKYLGITIDEVLSWNKQINDLFHKLSRTNGILCKLRNFLPNKTLISIYHALFYSHLIYGSLVWQFTTKINISRLSLIQRKCVRIMTFSDYHDHTNPLFVKMKILKVKDVFTLKLMKFVFSWCKKEIPDALINLLITSHRENLSCSQHPTFLLPRIRTETYGKRSLSYQAGYIWNSLSPKFRSEQKFSKSFISELRKYLIGFYMQ